MAQYVTRVRTEAGDLQIDYNALANLPQSDTTLTKSGGFADAKKTGEAIGEVSEDVAALKESVENIAENLTPQAIGAVAAINGLAPGEDGNVQLTASDVGAAEEGHTHDHLTGLTGSRVLVTDEDGNSIASDVTVEELKYLDGIDKNVQSQLNGKANAEHTHDYLPMTGGMLRGVTIAATTAVGTSGIRNIYAGTGAAPSNLDTGVIYIQYE